MGTRVLPGEKVQNSLIITIRLISGLALRVVTSLGGLVWSRLLSAHTEPELTLSHFTQVCLTYYQKSYVCANQVTMACFLPLLPCLSPKLLVCHGIFYIKKIIILLAMPCSSTRLINGFVSDNIAKSTYT